ncbi:MAG: YegS/Rv2252/BmrU family lipid kinase [Bacilli bacterium]|nr:YegS/Rv2252/BmrU family lipid kinase [Bacilli bacterium]
MKRCVVIYNPKCGKDKKFNHMNEFSEILLKKEYECVFIPTAYKNHAFSIMKRLPKVDLVISIGGDGTFNEIVSGNLKRKNRLLVAHIPYGTANDIGAMFGYGKNIINNLKNLLNGTVNNLDICLINDQPFVYVAGFGKFVNISYETPRELKQKFGYLAYLISGLKELNGETKLYNLKYTVDDKEYQGAYSFIMISNANRIGGIDNFYKDVKLNDNQFEVIFCDLTDKANIIKSLYYLKTKDITKVPGFYFYKTNNLKIEFENPLKKGWSIDGEEYINENDIFEIKVDRNFQILMPEKNIDKLFERRSD